MSTYVTLDTNTVVTSYGRSNTLPDNATEVSDDVFATVQGKAGLCKLVDGSVTDYAPPAPPVDLKAYAATARYAKETGGITVSGIKIATDRASQAMIGNAQNMVVLNSNFTTAWKGSDGTFTTLTAAQITGIASAVGNHVAACFAAEAQIDQGVTSGTIKTTADVDDAFAAVTA